MAERRMFAKTIIDSDNFLDMPLSAQALYFHLSMRADDDGFINNPKKIQRMIGASDDDCKLLLAKRFLIAFDSGVVVIKHWRIHNYIQKDRYRETVYQEEKSALVLKENGSYTTMDTECIQDGYRVDTQERKGNYSLGNDSLGYTPPISPPAGGTGARVGFIAPTVEQVKAYCKERHNNVDPEEFVDFYTMKGWRVGKEPMKDWKAAIRTWEKRRKKEESKEEGWSWDDFR